MQEEVNKFFKYNILLVFANTNLEIKKEVKLYGRTKNEYPN